MFDLYFVLPFISLHLYLENNITTRILALITLCQLTLVLIQLDLRRTGLTLRLTKLTLRLIQLTLRRSLLRLILVLTPKFNLKLPWALSLSLFLKFSFCEQGLKWESQH